MCVESAEEGVDEQNSLLLPHRDGHGMYVPSIIDVWGYDREFCSSSSSSTSITQ